MSNSDKTSTQLGFEGREETETTTKKAFCLVEQKWLSSVTKIKSNRCQWVGLRKGG